ncbi:MAG TPA: Ig-like domain repeat protein, partial [Candidatus Sulfotelmatobacter sp.]
VTGVGGTAIVYPSGFSSTYWGTSDTANNGGTAISYIPETGWNDDVELTLVSTSCSSPALTVQENCGIIQSGGGASNCSLQDSSFSTCVSGFPQPTWQTVSLPTAPPTGVARYSPDVALLASPNFPGYVYCTPVEELATSNSSSTASSCAGGIQAAVNGVVVNNNYTVVPSVVGGTSASAPVFAGMVTLLNQYLNGAFSTGLGNINPALYTLAASSPGAFHQVTSGTNIVYCAGATPTDMPTLYRCPGAVNTTGSFGYDASNADATTGYNLVTGLGSVDADVLFTAWKALRNTSPTTTALNASPTQTYQSGNVTLTATVTPASAVGPVTFSVGSTVYGTVPLTAGVATLSVSSLPVGAHTITASYGGNATLLNSTSNTASVTVVQAFTVSVGATSLQVTPGQSGTATINVTPAAGFTAALTFTCSDSTVTATGATQCSVSPSTPTTASSVSVSIPTAAPSAQLRAPLGSSRGIFYAALLPGLLGIVFTAGSGKRAARGLRFLSLILVLGFSTLWLGACSSNSGSTHTPGTPPGMYTVTINATTGGTSPVTASTTVTLNVQ